MQIVTRVLVHDQRLDAEFLAIRLLLCIAAALLLGGKREG